LWIKSEPGILMGCMPPDVQADIITFASTAALRLPPSKEQDTLNLHGFTALVLSVATQGFPDVAPEARFTRFFEFSNQSGGHTLMAV